MLSLNCVGNLYVLLVVTLSQSVPGGVPGMVTFFGSQDISIDTDRCGHRSQNHLDNGTTKPSHHHDWGVVGPLIDFLMKKRSLNLPDWMCLWGYST